MCKQQSLSALSTSSALLISSHPSTTNACSETATLTGAVSISWSLSKTSKPHTRVSPYDSDHESSLLSSWLFSTSVSSFFPLISESSSVTDPLPKGIGVCWKPAESKSDSACSESSFLRNIATMPSCFLDSIMMPGKLTSLAAERLSTLPTYEVIES